MDKDRVTLVVLPIIFVIFLFFLFYFIDPIDLSNKISGTGKNYKKEMVDLIDEMHEYAKGKNKDFNVIINGGYGLYNPAVNKTKASRDKLMGAVEGVLIEDIYYGWDTTLNKVTPKKERAKMVESVKYAQKSKVPVFNIEYCDGERAKKAKKKSKTLRTICYYAPSVELDRIPVRAGNEKNVRASKEVKNFCIILNPDRYKKKKDYLNALKGTDYDMIFIDAYFNDKLLSKKDVDSLKKKKNGKVRLVCSYISVGEAEDYRYYFKSSWKKNPPSWLKKENKAWKGNYKVKYWSKEWKEILYKGKNSYLNKLLNAGFDGAYFDVIDAYEYFE